MSELDMAAMDGTWDHGALPANVQVGEDCWLESSDLLMRFRGERDPAVVFGDRLRVYMWTRLSLQPDGYVEVGDDSILVGAMFMSAGSITLGRRVIVSYGVTIADADFHPLDPDLRRVDAVAHSPVGRVEDRQPYAVAPVRIDDDVRIGLCAMVLKGVQIGAGAQVRPGAVVTRDVPAGATVAGNPARIVEPDAPGPSASGQAPR